MTATITEGLPSPTPTDGSDVSFLWLEVTSKCNLYCVHCYADSGPSAMGDRVGTTRWLSLIDEAAALGIKAVQFIGGEPLLHPDIVPLI